MKIIIIMGSDKDLEFAKKSADFIQKFKIEVEMRIASAHKTPLKVLEILEHNKENNVVYITVAGRSNALSAFVDANTSQPVIACPPLVNDKFDTNLFSSIAMPSGIAPMLVIEPANAALAALKIFALQDKDLKQKITDFQKQNREVLEKKDKEVKNG